MVVNKLPSGGVVRRALVPGAKHTLVATHGVMSHAGWFSALAEALNAAAVDVVAVERRGSGLARELPGVCDSSLWVTDIVEAMVTCETPDVSLLGWCWGARTVILAAAVRAPRTMLFIAPGLAVQPHIIARGNEIRRSTEDPAPLPFAVDSFSRDPKVLAWIAADPLAWKGQPRPFVEYSLATMAQAIDALPTVDVPMHTFLASDDQIIDNDAVAKLLRRGPIETLEGGHALILEAPALVAERLRIVLGVG